MLQLSPVAFQTARRHNCHGNLACELRQHFALPQVADGEEEYAQNRTCPITSKQVGSPSLRCLPQLQCMRGHYTSLLLHTA